MKKALRYFLFLIILLLMYFLAVKLNFDYYQQIHTSFTQDFKKFVFINLISSGGIGLLLGVELFINEYKKSGNWYLDIPRLVIICIPSFFLALMPMLIFIFPVGNIPIIGSFIMLDRIPLNITIFNILLGYFLITSFRKK
ncbi:putative membrane protein [Clostridioides difficile CD160]|nr:putative membrane protein [Clostridioides difficile CD160]